MKIKKLIILVALLLFAAMQGVFAQRAITGKAIDGEEGLGMPGVAVLVKGTSTATQTNTAGNFSIIVPNNRAIIVVSFVGFKTVEVPVGTNTYFTITLQPDPVALGEVVVTARRNNEPKKVVTAMGIERDPITLPYVVRHVSAGDEFSKFAASGFATALAGVMPGVRAQKMGQGAGASEVVIVRDKIITLYIIDGVPINTKRVIETVSRYGTIIRETVYDDIYSFVNPLDIESVTVLPSVNAAMLYGSDGINGAIVITLKKQ